MIIETQVDQNIIIGDIETSEFTMANDSKLYMLLSDKIYTDKIMAPIRELLCNAYDAHVAAGTTDIPIQVTLPTKANDYTFAVRDFGTGLSAEGIKELYTKYGASNKCASNEFIGCLGLGSKAPFAYTKDGFMVVSYHNGAEYAYHCSRDGGKQSFERFPTRKTTEPNGLHVSFSVEPYDSSTFSDKLTEFSRTFVSKLHIIVPGGVDRDSVPDDLTDTDGFGVICRKAWWDDLVPRVLMGGVCYTYAMPKFTDALGKSIGMTLKEYNSIYNAVSGINWSWNRNPNFIVKANLGDVDIAASRESCEYTDKTHAFVLSKLKAFLSGVHSKFMAALDAKELSTLDHDMEVVNFYQDKSFLATRDRDAALKLNLTTEEDEDTFTKRKKLSEYTAYVVTKSKWRKDRYETGKYLRLSKLGSTSVPYASKLYNCSDAEMVTAIKRGTIRFVAMPEGSDIHKINRAPAGVYRLISDSPAHTVVMLFSKQDVEHIRAQGVEVTNLEDLPKPERTYTPRAKRQKSEVNPKTALEAAISRCWLVKSGWSASVTSDRIYYDTYDGSEYLRVGDNHIQLCMDSYTEGKLCYVKVAGKTKADIGITIGEFHKILQACTPTKESQSHSRGVAEGTAVLLARIAYNLGYRLICVPEDSKYLSSIVDSGIKHISEVFAEGYKDHKVPTKAELNKYLKQLQCRHELGVHTDADIDAYKQASRALKNLNAEYSAVYKLATAPLLEYECVDIWLSVFRYIGLSSSHGYSAKVRLDPVTFVRRRDDSCDNRSCDALRDINKLLATCYPAVADFRPCSEPWPKKFRNMYRGSFDPSEYIKAMNMWHSRSKRSNSKSNNGDDVK